MAINRRDFVTAPIPDASLLWRDLHVRDVTRTGRKQEQPTKNIRIEICVYCRPFRLTDDKDSRRMPVPPEAMDVRVAFLPPMSGLADHEFAKQPGEIGFLIGQGRTAEVLRNLCLQVHTMSGTGPNEWEGLTANVPT